MTLPSLRTCLEMRKRELSSVPLALPVPLVHREKTLALPVLPHFPNSFSDEWRIHLSSQSAGQQAELVVRKKTGGRGSCRGGTDRFRLSRSFALPNDGFETALPRIVDEKAKSIVRAT